MHFLHSCSRPTLGSQGDWIVMDCTDATENSVIFHESLTPELNLVADTSPGPPGGCSTPSTDGSSADRPTPYGVLHLACGTGYGVTVTDPGRYTSEIDFYWWYRSLPLIYAELSITNYGRDSSPALPPWAHAYKLWLRDMSALKPPPQYLKTPPQVVTGSG
jgi:hypothetical protein